MEITSSGCLKPTKRKGEDDWRAWDSDYLDKYDELKKKHLQSKNGK